MRPFSAAGALLISFTLGGCEVASREPDSKRDTATVPVAGAVLDTTRRSGSTSGVPAVASGAATSDSVLPDTGNVELFPAGPRRGGVLFAFVPGLSMQAPRCSWKGVPFPCYSVNGGVLATIPLSADEPAGRYMLTIDRPVGRIVRTIIVADREFPREVVLLTPELYELVKRSPDVARDARAARQILSVESPERAWTGKWREPIVWGKGQSHLASRYGTERSYFLASDSSRVINLEPGWARAAFGADTINEGARVPGWRHSGVDIAVDKGTRVVAPAAGMVADVGDYTLTGKTVLIDHGQGVFTAYFHLDSAVVQRGDQVRAGKVIGRVGSTGLATGPHLHYGVYVHGKDVDPDAWRAMPAFAQGAAGKTAN